MEWPIWKEEKDDENWRWSTQRSDFDRALLSQNGKFNVWGYWTSGYGSRQEVVHIASALVNKSRALSLLRAFQTAKNPHDYGIPDAGDDGEITRGAFRLKGWISVRDRDRQLDEFDPWSGDISYPPLRPASFVAQMLALEGDREDREWKSGDGKGVICAELWGQYTEKDSDYSPETGRRLSASPQLISELLTKTDMSLIVKVEIDRRHTRSRYHSNRDDETGFEYVLPSARIFLIDQNGDYTSL
jgi:hypothetical protein